MGMNIPGFFGYYNTHRALMANQVALNTINHNIANANTPGYSRQRADLTAASPYPPVTPWDWEDVGQIGQGVKVLGISRSHDNFLDGQIRIQNILQGFHAVFAENLQQAEGTLGVPSGSGINTAMSNFFAAAQAMSLHPEDIASRASFMQSARNMLDMFQQQAQQLRDLRTNLVGDPSVAGSFASSQAALTVDEINNHINEIANLNAQILTVVAGGASPNDLLDRRDVVLEELSKKLNITVEYKPSEQVEVRLGSDILVRGKDVLNTLSAIQNPGTLTNPIDNPTVITLSSNGNDVTANITGGRLGGILAVGGNNPSQTTVRSIMAGLDTLFNQLATEINALQAGGRDLQGNGILDAGFESEIFVNSLAGTAGLTLFDYTINDNIVQNPSLVAAASDNGGIFAGIGDGRNALAMAQLANTALAALGNSTLHEYFNAQIAQLGVNSKAAQDNAKNLTNVIQQLDQRRQSFQGVNMEEEMINLLRFQRGFEASAKSLSVMDSIFDLLINKMI